MTAPIEINIPHQLGKQGVRDRLDGGIGKIGQTEAQDPSVGVIVDGQTHYGDRAAVIDAY